MVGVFFCSECGTQLVHDDGVSTSALPQQEVADDSLQTEQPIPQPKAPVGLKQARDAILSFNIINKGEVLSAGKRKEVTLGRISKGQPLIPDIDLTPYKAYEAGVSRMHISVNIGDDLTTVTDLGSVNGTRINGRKIAAHIPHPIRNGDILTLGKFKIQILLKSN
jgi:pSer/pThr/pTyr-binding forkhead associated (FHA) protein